jgi:MFS family permease
VTIISAAGLVASIGQTLFLPVLPELPRLLGVPRDAGSLLVTITMVAGAVSIPTVARLADMYGKRRMIIVTLAVVAAGGVLGALADSFALVLVSRAMQGVGLALIPVGTSIFRDLLPRERLSVAVAFMSAVLGIGSAVSLPLSGMLFAAFGWHSLFWVPAVLSVALLVGVVVIVPESSIRTGGRFDVVGAVLLSVMLGALMLGITKTGEWGWTGSATLACAGIVVVLTALWVPWELRHRAPVLDLRSSAKRNVLLTNVMSFLVGFAFYVNFITATEQLQLPTATGHGFGASPLTAGLLMLPASIMMIVSSPVSAVITRRLGVRSTLMIGSGALACGYLFRALPVLSPWQVALGTMIVSVGIGLTYSALPIMVMRSVPVTETAAANGLNMVVRLVGTSVASAAVAAILTALTASLDGTIHASSQAFTAAHLLAACAALGAAAIACALPGRGAGSVAEARSPALAAERLVRGRVVDEHGAPVPHATVQVRTGGGENADWAVCDEAGAFAVAVPSDRSFEIVAQDGDQWERVGTVTLHPARPADCLVVVIESESGVSR